MFAICNKKIFDDHDYDTSFDTTIDEFTAGMHLTV